MSGYGAFLVAWLKEAREVHPGDLEAQARFVRRKVIEKGNEGVAAAGAWSEPSVRLSRDEGGEK